MKDIITPAKVGFVVVASVVATMWMFGQVGQSLTGDQNAYRVFAMLDDVSGLVEKSRVSIAGINVGQLDRVELVEVWDPPWTSDRITMEGREKLKKMGVSA